MRIAAIIFMVILILVLLVWTLLGRKRNDEDSSITICIPLQKAAELDPKQFTTEYKEQWGGSIACEENTAWGDPTRGSRAYCLTDGKTALVMSVNRGNLPRDLVDLTLMGMFELTESQKEGLVNHSGHILISRVVGAEEPVQRVSFAAKAMLTAMRLFPAVGYMNVSSCGYQPADYVTGFAECRDLGAVELFLLCTAVHSVGDRDGGRTAWMHTHGMEQFGLPDLEVKFREKEKTTYYYDLIRNASAYSIDEGPVMKPGHTAELAGDGVIYRIKAPEGESKGHFGRCGGLWITRD